MHYTISHTQQVLQKEPQLWWIHFQESNEVLLKIMVAFTAAWKWIYITYVPEKWRIFLFANMALKMHYLLTWVANCKDKLNYKTYTTIELCIKTIGSIGSRSKLQPTQKSKSICNPPLTGKRNTISTHIKVFPTTSSARSRSELLNAKKRLF